MRHPFIIELIGFFAMLCVPVAYVLGNAPLLWTMLGISIALRLARTLIGFIAPEKRKAEDDIAQIALNKSIDGLCLFDEGKFIYANPAARTMLGFAKMADLRGMHVRDVSPEKQPHGVDYEENTTWLLEVIARQGYGRFEWWLSRKNGGILPVMTTAIPVEIDGKTFVLSFWQDISDFVELREQKRLALRDLAEQLDCIVQAASNRIIAATDGLTAAASELSKTSEISDRRLEEAAVSSVAAAVNVADVATVTEQLIGTVREIARGVERNQSITTDAVADARRTTDTIHELSTAATQIGEISNLIGAIASRTNLLALNATIEAARAGDAGRGFAVVAQEVKSLATQTAQATEQIHRQIAAMKAVTDAAVQIVSQISNRIAQMGEASTSIADSVREQQIAASHIARHIQSVSSETASASGRIAEIRDLTARAAELAGEVYGRIGTMETELNKLPKDIETFKLAILAA